MQKGGSPTANESLCAQKEGGGGGRRREQARTRGRGEHGIHIIGGRVPWTLVVGIVKGHLHHSLRRAECA